MPFLFPFLKNITIFASFHVLGMRRSVMHFVYSLASCFAMVSSPAISVSISNLSNVILHVQTPRRATKSCTDCNASYCVRCLAISHPDKEPFIQVNTLFRLKTNHLL